MGRPDDASPSGDHPGAPADRSFGRSAGWPAGRGAQGPAEPRYRQDYHDDLRAAFAREARTVPRPATAPRPSGPHAGAEPWEETAGWSRRVWAEYQGKWPPEERAPADRPKDPPGSWRGEGHQFLDQAANERVEQWCDRHERGERETVSPVMLTVENADPDRHLAGFEYRLKGRDRIKEKVVDHMEEKGSTLEGALSTVKDAVRYTFVYQEGAYADGVREDLARLKYEGLEKVEVRNTWGSDQYKGVNSRWRAPAMGVLFEIQFHTEVSFEAKQLTHGAYERLRSGRASELEELALEAFQKKVFGKVPTPPGAIDIPDYPERDLYG